MLITTILRGAPAPTVLADPSKIAANPEHLILLAVVVLAAVGYLIYRRTRGKREQHDRDEERQ